MADTEHIHVQAGKKAFAQIKENGLTPEMVNVVAGAAGGPKWIVLKYLDHALFSEFFKHRKTPLHVVGSSSGAWRLAAICQENGTGDTRASDAFEKGYIRQAYKTKPSADEVSRANQSVLDRFLDHDTISGLLTHPYLRMNVMAVKSMGATASENPIVQGAGLTAAYLMNALNRKWLGVHFKRVLFYDPRTPPPFFNMNDFPLIKIPLTGENIKSALMASGSIPLVMSGVKDISGAPKGMYRDGGVIDYHMDLSFSKNGTEGLVLFPHYTSRIIPGWFDKKLTWRGPSPKHTENVVLVSPSEKFVKELPLKKIPDRDDFYLFKKRDDDRIAYWEHVAKVSRKLGEAFLESVASGRIKEIIKPL